MNKNKQLFNLIIFFLIFIIAAPFCNAQLLTQNAQGILFPAGSFINRQNIYYEYRKIDLVHQYQEYNLCAPTSASMMLAKFGFNYPPRQIKLATRGKPYFGPFTPFNDFTPMSSFDLINGLKYLNINTWRIEYLPPRDFDKALNNIKSSIRSGYPVMIFIFFNRSVGHAVVACGFDERSQEIITLDPGYPSPVATKRYQYSYLKNFIWKNFATSYYGGAFMNPVQARVNTATLDMNAVESMKSKF